ncbi:MAG TPA: 4-hydroxy-3-methylbut-2-enyl diphosphate reductase [Acidobacteriota bacterium]|nr:4-hydroxy-3-methylbut-2-enyl diphosphate reductase [Acidobacteriota bacterium]
MVEKVILAAPRGFCAGVVRAIDIVNIALKTYPKPVYVRKEIVHNQHVVQELREKGAIFVEELQEVPSGKTVIFSAHGVSPAVREDARRRNLNVIDATCPLVTKVHLEAVRYAKKEYTIVLIGHQGHDEVVGTMGVAPENIRLVEDIHDVEELQVDTEKVAYITQTTLSLFDTRQIIEALRRRFPHIEGPAADDICYATQNRQTAVRQMAGQADLVLVVGSTNSSNSNRLVEEAQKCGARQAYLIDDVEGIRPEWLHDVRIVGISSGASAPENLVEGVVDFFRTKGAAVEELVTTTENVQFNLPKNLLRDSQSLPTT